jgi:methyl-accepting chemotaxis protein
MRIGQRAALGFAVLALMLVMTGLFSLGRMVTLRTSTEVIEQVWLPGIEAIHDVASNVAVIRQECLRLIADHRDSNHFASLAAIAGERAELRDNLDRYAVTIEQADDRAQFEALNLRLDAYLKVVEQLQGLVERGNGEQAYSVLNEQLAPIGGQVEQLLEGLIGYNQQGADAASDVAQAAYRQSQWVIAGVVLLALLVTLFLAWWLTRSIVVPLREAVAVAERIAEGNLTSTIAPLGKDEPARLLQALAVMQTTLRGTLRRIGDSASQLATASGQMSAVMAASSHDLQRQTDEIEQAATAVTQMSSAVDEVAGNAVSTAQVSEASHLCTQAGEQRVAEATQAIESLVQEVLQASVQAGDLAEQAQDVDKVLDVIRGIAGQTNLLALNAAIEAARAGEAGRGFAVVADEVRALAQRTQDSTAEIESMIAAMQGGTQNTAQALENSAEQARRTLSSAGQARQTLHQITYNMAQINERNLVIASATEQQAQ